eukprot:CAMPEP_0172761180 /NCGR_PEP_ID=MMETSP1074-20121228/171113_1 /TAXON_ID=2916 /ORGANISM="Ceratium fusus, Strain PA161109" /LENGTH=106 /DNA_ID=CAMNT_0013595343 /DNA_START=188 /DNA_END=505 /DNA_ORIENTATION=-
MENRPNKSSSQRQKIKSASTPNGLLSELKAAISKNLVDRSVIGAAMQKCGDSRWWDTLMEVMRLQSHHKVVLDPVARNIFITALTKAVRDDAKPHLEPERRRQLLP